MFSNHERLRPHDGQAEAGHTIEAFRGRRWMQTLRKLPMMAPKRAAKVSANGPVIATAGAVLVPRASGTKAKTGTPATGRPESDRTAFLSDRLECREIRGRE